MKGGFSYVREIREKSPEKEARRPKGPKAGMAG